MTKFSYRFFLNVDCEYYPCHKGLDDINCLFCFCPLYTYADCGGQYKLSAKGIKDCTGCLKPHYAYNYDLVLKELREKKGGV